MREVVINPKYTGYMVWNRKATKTDGGKLNPPEAWVWPGEPTHEALVSLETFMAAQQVAGARKTSRQGPGLNTAHPDTKRSYVLRSYIGCRACARRMGGKDSRGNTYYVCRPPKGYVPDGHPKSIWVREEPLLKGINEFFAAHVFGLNRSLFLKEMIARADNAAEREHREEVSAVQTAIVDLDARRARLMRRLEADDDGESDEFTRDVRARTAGWLLNATSRSPG